VDTSRLNFCFLSGLPRTGSTVLSAILSQNPVLHAGQNSPVCQLMWDAQVSCETTADEQLAGSRRLDFQQEYISAIPHMFYAGTSAATVVDKCRSWTLPDNMAIIRRYITPTPRVIVMTRPLEEVVESLLAVYDTNGQPMTRDELLTEGSEPIMRSNDGARVAAESQSDEFLFVTYADFMADPPATLRRIYEFCEWEPFAHNFDQIICAHPEDDMVYGLSGLHTVRPTVGART
jgi:sulfotransferase